MNVTEILADLSVTSRKSLNTSRVEGYKQIVQSGEDLDPVVVFNDGKTYWLADGFHRHEAYKKAHRTDIPAEIRQGTRRNAILYAIEANAKHGLSLSLKEKKNAAAMLLQDPEWSQWSDRKIGKLCGINHETVKSLRSVSGGNRQIENFTKATNSPIDTEMLQSVSGGNRQIENFTNSDAVSHETRKVERSGKIYTIDTSNIGRNQSDTFFNMGLQINPIPALPASEVEILDLDPLTINAISTTVQETNDDNFRIVSIDCPEPAETSNSDKVVEFNVKVETLGPPDAWPTILNQLKAHPEFASMVWKEALKLELADTFKKDLLLV